MISLLVMTMTPIGYVDGWQTWRDSAVGCGMHTTLRDGTVAVFTLDQNGQAQMSAINPSWVSIKAGTLYNIKVQFGRKSYDGTASGYISGFGPGVSTKLDGALLSRAMLNRDPIGMTMDGKSLLAFYPNSNRPMYAVEQCAKGLADPFAH